MELAFGFLPIAIPLPLSIYDTVLQAKVAFLLVHQPLCKVCRGVSMRLPSTAAHTRRRLQPLA
jgi:hypothetical protein